jgi:hypothetical protein
VHCRFGLPHFLEQFISIRARQHRRGFGADTIGPLYNAVLKRDFLFETTPLLLHRARSFLFEEAGAQTAFSHHRLMPRAERWRLSTAGGRIGSVGQDYK